MCIVGQKVLPRTRGGPVWWLSALGMMRAWSGLTVAFDDLHDEDAMLWCGWAALGSSRGLVWGDVAGGVSGVWGGLDVDGYLVSTELSRCWAGLVDVEM